MIPSFGSLAIVSILSGIVVQAGALLTSALPGPRADVPVHHWEDSPLVAEAGAFARSSSAPHPQATEAELPPRTGEQSQVMADGWEDPLDGNGARPKIMTTDGKASHPSIMATEGFNPFGQAGELGSSSGSSSASSTQGAAAGVPPPLPELQAPEGTRAAPPPLPEGTGGAPPPLPEQQALPAELEPTQPAGELVPSPQKPGCYVRMPSGCVNHPEAFSPDVWKRDTHGEIHRSSNSSRTACARSKDRYDKWCGEDNAEMLLVKSAPARPSDLGCYVFLPSGCRSGTGHSEAAAGWEEVDLEDSNAENAPPIREAAGDAASDLRERSLCNAAKSTIDTQCGTTDAIAMLVVARPAEPAVAGCYYWFPSGCPKHKDLSTTKWRKDKKSEVDGSSSQEPCMEQKAVYGRWCGVDDVEMLLVH